MSFEDIKDGKSFLNFDWVSEIYLSIEEILVLVILNLNYVRSKYPNDWEHSKRKSIPFFGEKSKLNELSVYGFEKHVTIELILENIRLNCMKLWMPLLVKFSLTVPFFLFYSSYISYFIDSVSTIVWTEFLPFFLSFSSVITKTIFFHWYNARGDKYSYLNKIKMKLCKNIE